MASDDDHLRSPLRFDPNDPPCADDECILPASIAYPIMDERMTQGSGPDAPWRAKLAGAKAEYRRQKQQANRGDSMCQCNERRDAAERERAARQKMIADSANAWRESPAQEHAHADEQPAAPTSGMTREQIARQNLLRDSRDAHKIGGR